MNKQKKQLDSYSLLIVSKYFQYKEDYLNVIQVCKKFEETLDKFRYNPIPVNSFTLFPLIQTQYLYHKNDEKLDVELYYHMYQLDYKEAMRQINDFNKCKRIIYTKEDREEFGNEIPNHPNIVAIGKKCFSEQDIKTIEIPKTVTSIESECFEQCTNLKEITFPYGVKSIPYCCFFNCVSLENVVIPSSVTAIETGSFYSCQSLESIEFPSSIYLIGDNSFGFCTSLKEVVFHAPLSTIYSKSFFSCTSLTKVVLPSTLKYLCESCFEHCYSLKEIILPESLFILNKKVFAHCTSLESLIIPKSVNYIGNHCFSDCRSLTKLIIPSTVEIIGSNSFIGCTNLKEFEVPLQNGEYPFDVTYPETEIFKKFGIKSVHIKYTSDDGIVVNRQTFDPIIPEDTLIIGENCFKGMTDLQSFFIPSNIVVLEKAAFTNNCLTSISIPNTSTILSTELFMGATNLKEIEITAPIGFLDTSIFENCISLTSIKLPDTITSIDKKAFANCSNLVEINLPTGLKKIGEQAFYKCYGLKEILLPSTVNRINKEAFAECTQLSILLFEDTSLTVLGKKKKIQIDICLNCTNLKQVQFPCDENGKYPFKVSYQFYQQLKNLDVECSKIVYTENDYINSLDQSGNHYIADDVPLQLAKSLFNNSTNQTIHIPTNVTQIGKECFSRCGNLTSLIIPSQVKRIKKYAFYQCSQLKELTLPESVEEMGKHCFVNCDKLTLINCSTNLNPYKPLVSFSEHLILQRCEIECLNIVELESDNINRAEFIPHNINVIGYINRKPDLQEIDISTKYKALNKFAFTDFIKITAVTIPSSIERIGKNCFSGCSQLRKINIQAPLTFIPMQAFYSCSNLQSIKLPDSITRFDNFIFSECQQLTGIELPSNLQIIGQKCFSNCKSLKRLHIPRSVTKMKKGTFDFTPNLEEVTYDKHIQLKKLSTNCFKTCSKLSVLNIPKSVSIIGDSICYKCFGLTSLHFGPNIDSINHCAFKRCYNIKEITFKGVRKIDFEAFAYCTKLTSIELPSTIEEIHNGAFSFCSSLMKVIIPNSCTYIGSRCFYGCSSLQLINLPLFVPNMPYDVFESCLILNTILINKRKIQFYPYRVSLTQGLIFYQNGIMVESFVMTRDDLKFYNEQMMQIIDSIEDHCFRNCSGLKTMTLSTNITSLGKYSFKNCVNLESITLPSTITHIPDHCFDGCSKLKTIEIPTTITSFGKHCFANCNSLENRKDYPSHAN